MTQYALVLATLLGLVALTAPDPRAGKWATAPSLDGVLRSLK